MSYEDDFYGEALERNKRHVMRVVWFGAGLMLGATLAHLANWWMTK